MLKISTERFYGISTIAGYLMPNPFLYIKAVLFQTIQFSSIWPINRTLSGATPPGQSEPESDGNEDVLHIPQSSSIVGASPSDCLMSYLGHSLGGVLLLYRYAVPQSHQSFLNEKTIQFQSIQFSISTRFYLFTNS